MRGDFSRIRFNPAKHYTAVLEQQGRVWLDADANEQCAIDAYLRDTEAIDVIGEYGGPIDDAGFGITVGNNEILIGAGRYYVEGLLCENREPLTYGSQPFLIDPDPADADLLSQLAISSTSSSIQVWLEVWERLVTGLDDACLLEPALGQADTTVRRQTVWRVVAALYTPPAASAPAPPTNVTVTVDGSSVATRAVLRPGAGIDVPIRVAENPIGIFLPPRKPIGVAPTVPSAPVTPAPALDCCDAMYQQVAQPSTAAMTATTGGSGGDCGCQPIPSAGYRGLENQLYRVEIHQSGDENTATFKWSRENGSIVVAVQNVSGSSVQVNSLGPDANLGFLVGQWVEIYDDTYLFGTTPNQPGNLYQIKQVEQSTLTITFTTSVLPVDTTRNARLRRWDQSGSLATSSAVALGGGAWSTLENGIQVSFQPGQYSSGDAWTIVARTASGQIEWPPCGSDGNAFQPPHSTKIYRAPLACIHLNSAASVASESKAAIAPFTVEDCRRLFSPLTDLTPPVTPQAIHVTSYSWSNDDVVTLDQLAANGLTVTLDQAPTSPLTGANFSVALELAVPPSTDNQARFAAVASAVGAGLPSTILRDITILDSKITVNGSTITWQLPFTGASYAQQATLAYLDLLLLYGAQVDWFARARIKLLGKAIFLSSATGQTYLDGECLGLPATRADGKTPCIALQTPSGSGEKASDFEGWFYLAPTVNLSSITLNATAYTVTVNFLGRMTGVETGTPPQSITPQATINLTYPPLTATTVIILFTGPSGVGTVANMPQSVTVPAGQSSVAVPIDILESPGAGVTETFTITASVNTGVGPEPLQPVSFTITGAPPSVLIGTLGGVATEATAKVKRAKKKTKE